MNITMTPEDLANEYQDSFSCPLAKALNRVLKPEERLSVSWGGMPLVCIGAKPVYKFDETKWNRTVYEGLDKTQSFTLELIEV